ncbi:DUF975 family protein [Oscillospiraceae bacterium 44-34]
MEIDRKELKRQAKECIALTDPKFWVVALAYIAMTTGVSWLISLISLVLPSGSSFPAIASTQLFFTLLLNLYTAVVNFGLCLWALWTYRQLDPGVNSLMQGFSVAGRVLLMKLGVFVRILGWCLLGTMGISGPVFFFMAQDLFLGLLAFFFAYIALIVLAVFLALRYALAPYLLADRPDDGPSAAIYRSAGLMRGWKWQLFKLRFSFIGWEAINYLLSAAVLIAFLYYADLLTADAISDPLWRDQAIAVVYSLPSVILSTLVTIPLSLWLLPYRETALAGFYDARLMAASQTTDRPEMPPL